MPWTLSLGPELFAAEHVDPVSLSIFEADPPFGKKAAPTVSVPMCFTYTTLDPMWLPTTSVPMWLPCTMLVPMWAP